MTTKTTKTKKPAEQVVKDIRRATQRHFSAEDKIRIVSGISARGTELGLRFKESSGLV